MNTAEYFAWALKLTRQGSLIIVDNVVRKGAVVDTSSDDPSVQGVRRFYEMLAAEPRVSATAIQTVGSPNSTTRPPGDSAIRLPFSARRRRVANASPRLASSRPSHGAIRQPSRRDGGSGLLTTRWRL